MEGSERSALLEKEKIAREFDQRHGHRDMASPMACREKLWAELGIEEKVERLREILRQTYHTAVAANEAAYTAQQLCGEHVHGPTGQVFKPIYGGANFGSGAHPTKRHDPLA
jgi:hypothetical protein